MIKQNSALIDDWTVVHVASGYLIAKTLTKNRALAYSLIVGFEIVENQILRKQVSQFFKEQELGPNIASDILASIAGFELAR